MTPRVVVLSPAELEVLIEAAVGRALAKHAPAADDWVDSKSARALGLGRRKFYELVKAKAFPVRRAGRRLVARKRDVEAWLDSRPLEVAESEQPSTLDPLERAIAEGRLRVVGGRRA